MPLPELTTGGYLPPGLHAASLAEVGARFGDGSVARRRLARLLHDVVEAAKPYPTIKRVLIWGSFVTAKGEPADLDYSLVVSVAHRRTAVASEHRRFLIPADARRYYGVDRGYLVVWDYPLDLYMQLVDFLCHNREKAPCGVVEISLRGEVWGGPL
jgi:hypothetical protein